MIETILYVVLASIGTFLTIKIHDWIVESDKKNEIKKIDEEIKRLLCDLEKAIQDGSLKDVTNITNRLKQLKIDRIDSSKKD